MRILFDTNVLISAGLNPNGVPAQAIFKALDQDEFVVSQVNVDEFKEKIGKKFPEKCKKMLLFLQMVQQLAEILIVPERITAQEKRIRDLKDRPILRAALAGDVDVIVTGDKDFLEAGLTWPEVMTPAEFLDYDTGPVDDPPCVAEPK